MNTRNAGSNDGAGPMGSALQRATRDFVTLVGLEPESLSGVEPTDGGWKFWLEVEEMTRIPPSTSVMASYEVTTDANGEITGFRRVRRYHRSQLEGMT